LSSTRAILISAGALIDGSGAAPLRPGAVLIEGERITPGLIDCHVHLSDAGLADASVQDRDPPALRVLRMAEHARRTLAAGFTTVDVRALRRPPCAVFLGGEQVV
jgi:imidazolonepropionase-like amidohydrolase